MAEYKPGIYLEVKKTVIGTGHTAKEEVYRNFWMTLDQEGAEVNVILLDEDFKPTPIRQTLPLSQFTSGRLAYIPQGDKRFQNLIKRFGPPKKAAPKPEAEKAAEPKKPAGWWEAPPKEVNPGDIFKREEKGAKTKKPGESSGAWWEGSSKTITTEDLFRTSSKSDKKDSPHKSKPPQKRQETRIKKTWWDK